MKIWNCFDFLLRGVFVKKGHMRNHCCAIFGHFLVGHIDLNNGEYDSKFDNSFRFYNCVCIFIRIEHFARVND